MTNIQSFINLRDWLDKIREFSDPHVIIGLVANKCDLVEEDDREKGYGKYAGNAQGGKPLDTEEDDGPDYKKLNNQGYSGNYKYNNYDFDDSIDMQHEGGDSDEDEGNYESFVGNMSKNNHVSARRNSRITKIAV